VAGSALASVTAFPLLTHAQSLRGSPASIARMARYADKHDLYSYQTRAGVLKAVARGRLVKLNGSSYKLSNVHYPYVRPATRMFVNRLSKQYRAACGETLVVTSAVRPESAQPWNSVPESVHPTGIAVDLRKPAAGHCRTWLRSTLLELEETGVLEATEEFHPPHFHVAVYAVPYRAYVRRIEGNDDEPAADAASDDTPVYYTVRTGDTLWDIARSHHTTVDRIKRVNRLKTSRLQPKQKLRLP
jgi:hypothetical protein